MSAITFINIDQYRSFYKSHDYYMAIMRYYQHLEVFSVKLHKGPILTDTDMSNFLGEFNIKVSIAENNNPNWIPPHDPDSALSDIRKWFETVCVGNIIIVSYKKHSHATVEPTILFAEEGDFLAFRLRFS